MENSGVTLTDEQVEQLATEADKNWDKFYGIHQNRFFKDRNWLFTEFPELAPHLVENDKNIPEKYSQELESSRDSSKNADDLSAKDHRIFEIGCGVGNTIFPILQYNDNRNLFIYGCDFSSSAIEILKENPSYDGSRCEAFVLDATKENWQTPFDYESLDVILLIFVFSSIPPEK